MFFLQGAKGFYDLLLISALFFCFFIRRSKTADLVQNLVYIILDLDILDIWIWICKGDLVEGWIQAWAAPQQEGVQPRVNEA